jgi:hypothetical protein
VPDWCLRVEILTQYVGTQAVFGSRRGSVAGASGLSLWVSCQLAGTLTIVGPAENFPASVEARGVVRLASGERSVGLSLSAAGIR